MTPTSQPQWITALERESTPLLAQDLVLQAIRNPEYIQYLFGFEFRFRNQKYMDGKVALDLNEAEKLRKKIEEKFKEESGYLDKVAKRHYEQCERIIEVSKEISGKENLRNKSREELLGLFERYVEEVLRMMPSLMIIPTIERILQEEITAGLENKVSDEGSPEDYLDDLINPEEEDFVTQDLRGIIRLGARIQTNPELEKLFDKSNEKILQRLPQVDEEFYSNLKEHANEFGFLDMYTYLGEPFKIEDIVERLKDIISRMKCKQRLKEIEEREERKEERYKEIISELSISGELLEKIEQARSYLYLRLYRLNIVNKGGALVRGFMEEIARRMGFEYQDIIFLTHQEIIEFLKKNKTPDKEKIRKRQEVYATILVNGDLKLLSGREEVKAIAEEEEVRRVQEMSGETVSQGTFKGKAKVVLTEAEIGKIKEGDVLVTTMTNPSYVPAMIKAGAVVTDEGGILSHAGIVSRELGIPCVAGTEVASKILSDGDAIEVQAGKRGKVIVLERGEE